MIDQNCIIDIIKKINKKYQEEAMFLTELDNVIGDGDHGTNLARGFQAVAEKLEGASFENLGELFKIVGITLVSTVGGASGPLYGTIFLRASSYSLDKTKLSIQDFVEIMKVAIDGVMARGKAVQGEKTMLDSMIPALTAMEDALIHDEDPDDVIFKGWKAAEKGVEYTKSIVATKGRASYLGERSLGHQDPGATSFAMLLQVISSSL